MGVKREIIYLEYLGGQILSREHNVSLEDINYKIPVFMENIPDGAIIIL